MLRPHEQGFVIRCMAKEQAGNDPRSVHHSPLTTDRAKELLAELRKQGWIGATSRREELAIINRVVRHLNQASGKMFNPSTKANVSLIRQRLKEGFTEQQMIDVINSKTAEWLNTTQEKYLRPITLFGPKMEGYVNEKTTESAFGQSQRVFREFFGSDS